jgi:hypothetical protein
MSNHGNHNTLLKKGRNSDQKNLQYLLGQHGSNFPYPYLYVPSIVEQDSTGPYSMGGRFTRGRKGGEGAREEEIDK